MNPDAPTFIRVAADLAAAGAGGGLDGVPGASLAGETEIGEGCWIGMRSAVIEQLSVGRGVVIGAGAVVIRNIPDNSLVVGIPARIVKELDPFAP